ncbi:unnamed protein product, partial [Pylaiella littoralis]
GPRAEAKPLGSPEHCTSRASSPRFSDGRFAVGEDGHRHGGRALWMPLAPVVSTLQLVGGEHAWKKHFITRESWFDLRLCILGFVSTCRFLFDRPAIFQVDSLSPNDRRFIGPRSLSQDLIEHRFSHYRGNNGTHRNPTAQEVKTRSQTGDVIRALNGKTRRNSNINANGRVGQDFHVADTSGEIMMAVTREETSRRIRAASRNTHKSVLCPRSASRPPSYASFRKRRPDHNPEMDHPNPYEYGFWRDGPKRGKWGAPLFLHYVPLESA